MKVKKYRKRGSLQMRARKIESKLGWKGGNKLHSSAKRISAIFYED